MDKLKLYDKEIKFYKKEVEQYKRYTRRTKWIFAVVLLVLLCAGYTFDKTAFTIYVAISPLALSWYASACVTAVSIREQKLFDLEFEKKILEAEINSNEQGAR